MLVLSDDAAVVVVADDGWVVEENEAARKLFGIGRGRLCWDYVGTLGGARGLPCAFGCVQELLSRGMSSASRTHFTVNDKPHYLSCVPLDGRVLCVIAGASMAFPEGWTEPTPNEMAVLIELAAGGTTESMSEKLGLDSDVIREHIESLQERTDTPTAAALVAKAFRLGLLS